MADDRDYDLDEDLGQATIVYDDPEAGVVDHTVPNEHIAYFQDHWMVKIDEDEQGRDRIRRIPSPRVHYVERTVDEFADEMSTMRSRVESLASGIRGRLPGGEEPHDDTDEEPNGDAIHIDVTDGDDDA